MAVWISAFFSPSLPLFARAARAGITTDAMMTERSMSFFKVHGFVGASAPRLVPAPGPSKEHGESSEKLVLERSR
jgi:hypothetical protein